MNVLSLFDGISYGMLALKRANIKVSNYYSSEINKNAIKLSEYHYPNIIRLGDVVNINANELPKIDLLIGGSPCQGFSFAGKLLNFNDPRSKLFYEFARILIDLKSINPNIKFLLENVKMKKEWSNLITDHLCVEPIENNSALFSAQNRRRLYWTNIKIDPLPIDKGVYLNDIIEDDALPITLTERRTEEAKKIRKEYQKLGRDYSPRRGKELVQRTDNKSNCLTATFSNKEHLIALKTGGFRNLSPLEWERLQTLPDHYTTILPYSQRYHVIGNGWNIDTIAFLLKNYNSKQ